MKAIKIVDFKDDVNLKSEIRSLIEISYVDPAELLEREFSKNDTIYAIRDDEGVLLAFFMTCFENINDNLFIYLGLSGVKHEYKNTGIGKYVYCMQIEDNIQSQSNLGKPIYCWATTATPFAFMAGTQLFDNVNPDINGSFSEENFYLATLVCKKYNFTIENNNPFVLKNVAQNTLYSDTECERIERFVKKTNFQLFNKLGINEQDGDRLLMILRLPSREKLESLKDELNANKAT
jgi:hypothetical protein